MKYNGFTNAGSIYQAKCKANELPIKFVKVKVGNGLLEETEDPAKFIDIKSLKKEVGISEKTQIQDAVRLTIQMDNDGVNEGYFPREFGIYVEDEGVEVLYWYVNDGNEASYLPSQNTAPVKLKNHFNIIATSLESLIVNWDGKEFWVDKEYLGKELAKKEDKIEIKESAFNRPFGTLENEVLEGIQLARTLGLEYGGELNNSNTKKLNTVYYDTQNKSFFKCFRENTLNYADSNYYEGISNNDLLLKLQNLHKYSYFLCDVDTIITKNEKVTTYKNMTNNLNLSHNNGLFIFNQPGIYKVDITYNISGLNSYRDLNLKVVKSDGKIQYAGVIINTSSGAVAESVSGTVSVILNSKEVDNFYITANTSSLEATQIRFVKEQNFILITKLN